MVPTAYDQQTCLNSRAVLTKKLTLLLKVHKKLKRILWGVATNFWNCRTILDFRLFTCFTPNRCRKHNINTWLFSRCRIWNFFELLKRFLYSKIKIKESTLILTKSLISTLFPRSYLWHFSSQTLGSEILKITSHFIFQLCSLFFHLYLSLHLDPYLCSTNPCWLWDNLFNYSKIPIPSGEPSSNDMKIENTWCIFWRFLWLLNLFSGAFWTFHH